MNSTMNYEKACSIFGIKPTRRQAQKWANGHGIARRLADHFGPIHEDRNAENEARKDRNEKRREQNKPLEEGIEELQAKLSDLLKAPEKDERAIKDTSEMIESLKARLMKMEPMLPVPATDEEVRAWINETSRAGMR